MKKGASRQKRIEVMLPAEVAALRIFKETDSTNTRARLYAVEGGQTPALFIADSQTAGRGRTGKSFYSPKDTGLYASLLLAAEPSSAVYMTTAAAVAVRRAIERVTGISTDIKWVNDLYLNGKKVAGILCESLFVGDVGYVIIGFGVNISTSTFPQDISCTAASLGLVGNTKIKDDLAVACTEELLGVWKSGLTPEILGEYKYHSAVLGRAVRYCENGVWHKGVTIDIDSEGRLTVRLDDGSVTTLSSGEISVRLI
jgi:BirA family biotin operon repressor/biotin-[acetyl-CoA-carboxylase] ligase